MVEGIESLKEGWERKKVRGVDGRSKEALGGKYMGTEEGTRNVGENGEATSTSMSWRCAEGPRRLMSRRPGAVVGRQ